MISHKPTGDSQEEERGWGRESGTKKHWVQRPAIMLFLSTYQNRIDKKGRISIPAQFRAVLTAVKAETAGGTLHTTHPRHQPLATPPAAALTPGYRVTGPAAVDGNSVDMDAERTAFAENTLRYEASLRFMQSMVSGLQQAITGQ